jgi:hypothetical protein
VLSPDALWLTIAQGFARHVELNAEELRPRLVRKLGAGERRRLEVETFNLGSADDWEAAVDGFTGSIAEHAGPGMERLFTCESSRATSTTCSTSSAASPA